MEEQQEWEVYGLTEEEWTALSEEDKAAYRAVGEEPNMAVEIEEE